MDATHHPVFPLSPQLVFEWFNRDIKRLEYIHNVTKVMCALYVRCALSVLQKECRKVWSARYTLGARYRLENTVIKIAVTGVQTKYVMFLTNAT